jgi:Flp pilus assembly protein TadD
VRDADVHDPPEGFDAKEVVPTGASREAISMGTKSSMTATLRQVVADRPARHPAGEPEQVSAGSGRKRHDTLSSARRALNHRLFFRAKGLLRAAIKERPDSAEPWYLLGVLYEAQHEPATARQAYETALQIDPGCAAAESRLMRLRFEK